MTAQELKNLVIQRLTRVGEDRITDVDIRTVFNEVIDFITSSQLGDLLPFWQPDLDFNNNGTGAGAYCIYVDYYGNNRFWKSKINSNINNEPPLSSGFIETDQWVEISPSFGSSIQLYAPGIFGDGLVIVAHNHSVDGRGLYWLSEAVPRPFESVNIENEIVTNKWIRLGGSGGGGSSSNRLEIFEIRSNLFTEQEASFRGLISNMSVYITNELLSVTYEARLDTGAYSAHANLVALQAWINANITGTEASGTVYWIKVLATYKPSALGRAEVRLTYTAS
jgi:hypothetical protein